MYNSNQFPVTKYTKFPEKYYFLSIVNNIIKIADLKNTNQTILDFGCGNKIFSKLLNNKKILNYDINPNLTEIYDFKEYKFDIVILNHVLMYMEPKQIEELFINFKKINPKLKLLIGLGKQNILSKILKTLSLTFNAHEKTKSSFDQQIHVFSKYLNIRNQKNIFFMTKILYAEFIKS